MTVQEKAEEFAKYFETRERKDGEKYICTRDDEPEELTDLIHTAHGDMLPDDWRYEFISAALDAIADCENPEEIEIEPDIYTNDLTRWLHSRNDRLEYLDEAISQAGPGCGAVDLLVHAQYIERREVFDSVLSSLENLI